MSDIGSNTFRINKKRRVYGGVGGTRPIRMKCVNCGNKVQFTVQVRQLFALPKGQHSADGYDRQMNIEHWCFNCIRGAHIEEDAGRTRVSVNE
jgi:hypothetical protein